MFLGQLDVSKAVEVGATPATLAAIFGVIAYAMKRHIKEYLDDRREDRRDRKEQRQAMLTIVQNLYTLQRVQERTSDDMREVVDEAKERAHGVLTKFEVIADRIERAHPKSGVINPPDQCHPPHYPRPVGG